MTFSPVTKNFLLFTARILILSAGLSCFGSRGYYLHFEKVVAEKGGTQHTINTIAQDQRGFLWIGTQDGLFRYDGYEFKPYKNSFSDPNSLSDNYVSKVVVGEGGVIWASTQSGGLNGLNTETQEFVHYRADPSQPNHLASDDVFTLCQDSEGLLWIGSFRGLDVLDPKSGQIKRIHFNPNPEKDTDLMVRALLADGADIWIGAYTGLYKYNKTSGDFQVFKHDPTDPASLAQDKVRALFRDSLGTLWVGTNENGLSCLSAGETRFRSYAHDPEVVGSLSQNQIRVIHEDREGQIWVGTDNGGLNLFDRQNQTFTNYQHEAFQPNTLPHNEVNTIYEDRSGVIWIGTFGGLCKLGYQTQAFHHFFHKPFDEKSLCSNDIASMFEDSANRIWIGTWGGGLSRFDQETRTFENFQVGKNGVSLSNEITAISQDREGQLWCGTWGKGVSVFNPDSPGVERRDILMGDRGLSHSLIRALVPSKQGGMWVGTWGGSLNYYNPDSDRFEVFSLGNDEQERIDNRIINCLFEDEEDLWIGTNAGGLNQFNRQTGFYKNYKADRANHRSISHNRIRDIMRDSEGTLWIATNSGLNRFAPQMGAFIVYGESDGLPGSVTYCIREAEDGMLWLSTKQGLVRFDPVTGISHAFDQNDGLQHDRFNQGAALRTRSGQMLFGGINGFNIFNPNDIKINTHRPPVFITSIKVDNTEINPSKPFQLNYKDRMLTFTFAAMDFAEPDKNRYAFKLDGFHEQWVDHGTQHEMTFTNLDPGNYVFKVKGANNDGFWYKTSTDVHFKVFPPFWQTKIAYALFFLIGVGGVGLSYQLKARSMKRAMEARARYAIALEKEVKTQVLALREKDEALLQTQKKLISQEKMASLGTLTAGIAHEIKNPLNFVINCANVSQTRLPELVELAREEHIDREELLACLEDLGEMIDLINKHGKRADDIVRGMLMHSRNQPGSKVLCDLNKLLDEYVELTSFAAFEGEGREPVLKKEYDPSLPMLRIVPQNVGRVIVNLTNNAIQAMKDKAAADPNYRPQLIWKTVDEGDMAVMMIRDNGMGVPKDIQSEIFTPFFTTREVDGAGLGLSISYDIVVREHQGEFTLESEPGLFTQFRVALPKQGRK